MSQVFINVRLYLLTMIRFRIQAVKRKSNSLKVLRCRLQNAGCYRINRVTLSKMINQRGYSTVTDNLDKLCRYFGCGILDKLAEYVPDRRGWIPAK